VVLLKRPVSGNIKSWRLVSSYRRFEGSDSPKCVYFECFALTIKALLSFQLSETNDQSTQRRVGGGEGEERKETC
jgi:hypothetical protein